MALNQEQVLIIEADVKRAALAFDTLHEELVDHICCQVEDLLAEGNSFSEAYEIAKKEFSLSTLQSIEKNTLLLIDKNYALMKTFMKISGNISLVLIALGTVLKIFDTFGANIFLVLGFGILCLVFIPSFLYTFKPDPVNKKNLPLKISVVLGSVLFAGGILFKTMIWNGSSIILILSYSIILLFSLPMVIYGFHKDNTDKSSRKINTFGVVALMVFILSTMLKMFHWPGALILMTIGSIMLVTIFLPLFTYRQFKKSGMITGQFIFLIILSIYIVTMSLLMSFPTITEIVLNR